MFVALQAIAPDVAENGVDSADASPLGTEAIFFMLKISIEGILSLK
ncbi:hypothetical protein [Mesorhizobium sp. L-8-10]|nr:hypothetical protein [Mesorhizobium sp. L-8-10]